MVYLYCSVTISADQLLQVTISTTWKTTLANTTIGVQHYYYRGYYCEYGYHDYHNCACCCQVYVRSIESNSDAPTQPRHLAASCQIMLHYACQPLRKRGEMPKAGHNSVKIKNEGNSNIYTLTNAYTDRHTDTCSRTLLSIYKLCSNIVYVAFYPETLQSNRNVLLSQ